MAELQLVGEEALLRLFNSTSPKEAKKAVRRAARKGARIIADSAKSRVPKSTGTLRRSIKVRAIKRNRKGKIGSTVITGKGFFKGETYYGGFVEYGTQYQRPQPFIRPAMDSNKNETLKAFIDELHNAIDALEKK